MALNNPQGLIYLKTPPNQSKPSFFLSFFEYKSFEEIIYIYIYHHHHVVPPARISLTLSRHSSLSFIASGRSSGLHPISSQSCCMCVRAGRPAFARPCVGVHRSTSLMSSSLLLQQCPACLVRLTYIYIYIYIYTCVRVYVCMCVEATREIDLYVNAYIRELVCFKQGAISTLSGRPPKLVDKFAYFGRSISSTESDVKICMEKAVALSVLLYRSTTSRSSWRKDSIQITKECYEMFWTNPGSRSQTIQVRRTRHAGCSRRSKDDLISDTLLFHNE